MSPESRIKAINSTVNYAAKPSSPQMFNIEKGLATSKQKVKNFFADEKS